MFFLTARRKANNDENCGRWKLIPFIQSVSKNCYNPVHRKPLSWYIYLMCIVLADIYLFIGFLFFDSLGFSFSSWKKPIIYVPVMYCLKSWKERQSIDIDLLKTLSNRTRSWRGGGHSQNSYSNRSVINEALVVLTFWQLDFKHCISSTFKNIVFVYPFSLQFCIL